MDMDWLRTVQTEKEEAISFMSQNRRHNCILPQHHAVLKRSILANSLKDGIGPLGVGPYDPKHFDLTKFGIYSKGKLSIFIEGFSDLLLLKFC